MTNTTTAAPTRTPEQVRLKNELLERIIAAPFGFVYDGKNFSLKGTGNPLGFTSGWAAFAAWHWAVLLPGAFLLALIGLGTWTQGAAATVPGIPLIVATVLTVPAGLYFIARHAATNDRYMSVKVFVGCVGEWLGERWTHIAGLTAASLATVAGMYAAGAGLGLWGIVAGGFALGGLLHNAFSALSIGKRWALAAREENAIEEQAQASLLGLAIRILGVSSKEDKESIELSWTDAGQLVIKGLRPDVYLSGRLTEAPVNHELNAIFQLEGHNIPGLEFESSTSTAIVLRPASPETMQLRENLAATGGLGTHVETAPELNTAFGYQQPAAAFTPAPGSFQGQPLSYDPQVPAQPQFGQAAPAVQPQFGQPTQPAPGDPQSDPYKNPFLN